MELSDTNGNEKADIGELITYGVENFYVVSNDGVNIKALTQYNLNVGGDYDNSTYTEYYFSANGWQQYDMEGYKNNQGIYHGIVPFNKDYSGEELPNVYDISLVKTYVDNYKNLLLGYGINVISASLLTTSDLENLGCSSNDGTCSNENPWVYSTSYWTGEDYNITFVWAVKSTGELVNCNYSELYYGVRPVITIPASDV